MEQVLTVTELNFAIKKHLEGRFPLVYVKGEISNLKEQTSGHLYFTVKDPGAQLSCVLFKTTTSAIPRLPKNGDQVILKGEISVYTPRGGYQLVVRDLRFKGVGELLMRLHELKAKLEALGWFDKIHKKPLPHLPKTIGIVTSPTGAVIQDILHILNRRFASVHVLLNPVKVQGEGAALEIAKAIEQFNHYQLADVLIVGRGGGSLEDLFAFNEEIVASAIFHSQIPIISAVGHETDTSIADFVADIRAPTPSAAAELVISEKKHHVEYLSKMQSQTHLALSTQLRTYRHKLTLMAKQPMFSSPYALLGQAVQRLDDFSSQLQQVVKAALHTKKLKLQAFQKQLSLLTPTTKISFYRNKLNQLAAHLRAIDPHNLLKKGYAILFKEGAVVTSIQEVKAADRLQVQLHDGRVFTKVCE